MTLERIDFMINMERMMQEEYIVGKCGCCPETYHPMGAKCHICGMYANNKAKMVSKDEYNEIVAIIKMIEAEYQERVRQLANARN